MITSQDKYNLGDTVKLLETPKAYATKVERKLSIGSGTTEVW